MRSSQFMVGFGLICAALSATSAPADEPSSDFIVCDSNAYALCSHADCQCLDPDGRNGSCQDFAGGAVGWAKCDCPVVRPSERLAYNANFGNLGCGERAEPQATGSFPPFMDPAQVADVYSMYSLGDSLDGKAFGTLAAAPMMTCTQPESFTLCLNMPCELDPATGRALCFCQNVSSKCQAGKDCPWNTFGGGCGGNCDLGPDRIWSAALVKDTEPATDKLVDYIRKRGNPSFKHKVKYCDDLRTGVD